MANIRFKSVDDYVASHPERVQTILEQVRGVLRGALPGAEEAISYQIPTYKVGGRAVIYFAGWKAHYSVYPATAAVLSELAVMVSASGDHKSLVYLENSFIITR